MSSEARFSPTLRLGKVFAAATAEEIHAAAAAAVKSLPGGRSTVFFSESEDSSGAAADDKSSDDTPDTPESSRKSATAIPESPPASPASDKGNPLASILGYSDDEVSGPGDDSPRLGIGPSPQLPSAQQNQEGHPQQPKTQHNDAAQEDAQQQPAAALQTVQQQAAGQLSDEQQGHSKPGDAGTPSGDGLDAELASFMHELESSGLLAGADIADAEGPAAANTTPAEPALDAAAGNPLDAAASAGTGVASSAAPSGEGNIAAAESTSAFETGQAASAEEPAEQRTLGQLREAPEWFKVLDTGSNKVYYWNVNSNEVLWEPPEGINGDKLILADDAVTAIAATTAEAEEKRDTEAADVGAVSGALEAAEPTDAAKVLKQEADALVLEQKPDADMPDATEAAVAPMELAAPVEPAASPMDGTAGGAPAAECNLAIATVQPTDASPSPQKQQQQQQSPAPQQDVQAVFLTLLQELQAPPAAKRLLCELPEAVKLTLQLQLLHQQWQAFAARQSAVAVGDGEQLLAFDWVQYELYIMQQLQQAVQRLQPAVKELLQHSKPAGVQELTQAPTSKAAVDGELEQHKADAPAAGSSSPPTTAAADSSEEGEVPESSDDIDMDIDTDATETMQQQQPQLVSTSKPAQQPTAAPRRSRHRGGARARKAAYTAAGTYTSTAYMPAWAQPTHHYDFRAGYINYDRLYDRGYDAAYDAFHRYDAAYAQQYDPMYTQQYDYGSGYSGDIAVGYGSEAPAAVAVGGPPPLPDEAPPPLPEEPAPPGDAENPPLPLEMPPLGDTTAAAADGTAVAAVDKNAAAATTAAAPAAEKPKRKQYVSQPVRNPAAAPAAAEGGQPGWAAEELAAAAAPSTTLMPMSGIEAQASRSITPPVAADEPQLAPAAAAATGIAEGRKRVREKEKGRTTDGPSAKLPKAGKMSVLLNKWASVRQQQEEEEAERQRRAELAADPEYQEQKRLQQMEKWKQQQLQSGAADDNPNFTPVAGDWRAKLGLAGEANSAATPATSTADEAVAKAARKAARKAAKQAAKQAAQVSAAAATDSTTGGQHWPTNSKTKPDLDALSVGLPVGWIAMWDKVSGDIYYGNPTTKETSWERP